MNNFFPNIWPIRVAKKITLDANNDEAYINLFQLYKNVEIREIYGEIVEGSIVNLTELYIELYDGTNNVLLSANGAILSGGDVGSLFVKDDDAAEILKVSLADQARLIESVAAKDTFQSLFVSQKFGADTFIRLHYRTTETPINAKLKIYIRYRLINGGFLKVVS